MVVLFVLINRHQISANSFNSQSDSPRHSSIYNDLSSEEIDEDRSPILIRTNNLYLPDDEEEIAPRNPWSRYFRRQPQRLIYSPKYYSSPSSALNLRRGEIRYIPYLAQKRAIPIEFQKALFAHGIVGRRR